MSDAFLSDEVAEGEVGILERGELLGKIDDRCVGYLVTT